MPLPNLGMNQMITQNIFHDYVRSCVMCNTIDKGLGLYTPIHASSCPCKNVVRDFDGGLPISLCFQYIGVHVGLKSLNDSCLSHLGISAITISLRV